MSPSATRRYSGIALIIVLAAVAAFLYRHVRHAETAAQTASQVTLVSPNPKLKPVAAPAKFSIDEIAQGQPTTVSGNTPIDVTVNDGQPTTVLGWAIDGVKQAPASKVFLVVDGTTWIQAEYGQSRPDVGRVMGSPSLNNTGFRAIIPAGVLSTGRHSLGLAIVDVEGTGFFSGYSLATLVAGS